ncbi:MAG: hypothetical protein PVF85_01075 [Anaerolineales bacterium]|jgi:hypothetical protein
MTGKRLHLAALLAAACALAACADETPTPITIVETVEVTVETTSAPPVSVPFLEDWQGSPHADDGAQAFSYWNGEDPPEVPPECAQCHSKAGYLDYLGEDGSSSGVVDSPAPAGAAIACVDCHNPSAIELSEVTLPSGLQLTDLGPEARCILCHQGQVSKRSVDQAVNQSGVLEDTVSDELEFIEFHGDASVAIRYGALAQGGYEYEGKSYDTFFFHIEGYDSCQDCHDPHTLDLKLDECSACHGEIGTINELRGVRAIASQVDYDGDDDIEEGIFYEIAGLQEKLLTALQAYALEQTDTALGYHTGKQPHFFVDTNQDGVIAIEEATPDNRFDAWTPRLLKAAFNYNLIMRDRGAYAHGDKYAIQLLWDSIESLNAVLENPVDLAGGGRTDLAHFAGSSPAFRHWDTPPGAQIPEECGQCHSAAAIPQLISDGELASQAPSNGLYCSTCHRDVQDWSVYNVTPKVLSLISGLELRNEEFDICVTCHLANRSAAELQSVVANLNPDITNRRIEMLDMHFTPAGSTVLGSLAGYGFEYPGKTYAGRFDHVESYDTCSECHDAHSLVVDSQGCPQCHLAITDSGDLNKLRFSLVDFDGDNDTSEGFAGEIATMLDKLYARIQDYATDELEAPIIYDDRSYPYFFNDSNGDGKANPDEVEDANRFVSWSPRLLKAAYNYRYAAMDPGAFAHNGIYVLQLLYDSIEDLGGSVAGPIRP